MGLVDVQCISAVNASGAIPSVPAHAVTLWSTLTILVAGAGNAHHCPALSPPESRSRIIVYQRISDCSYRSACLRSLSHYHPNLHFLHLSVSLRVKDICCLKPRHLLALIDSVSRVHKSEILSFLALLDYVNRAHEIKIRPSSVVCRPSVRPSVCGIDYLWS